MSLIKHKYISVIILSLSFLLENALFAEASATADNQKKWSMFDPHLVKNSYHLWLEGDFLFWKSNVGSLEYGVASKSGTSLRSGHVKHLHFDWDFGARLGLGYKLPHDKWDILATYTYVHGQAHGHAGGSDHVVFPVWAARFHRVDGPFFADSAKAHWDMNLNIGDIELGRTCFAGKWLSIRPFLGVRGLVIDQDYSVSYRGGTVASSDTDSAHLDTDFWGVGIRMGADTLWGVGKGVSVYGNGSVALLGADFDVHEREKLKKANVRIMDVERDVDNVVVTADLALGVQWDYMLSKDRYHFGVKLGWEFNLFFNQNQLFNFQESPGAIKFREDDLTFEGLTLGFRFDF
jgi:Legionella pneumophila major outer membrane protein precursor